MLLFGDAFHKFIDGVSVGASFSESIFTGFSVAIAIVFEELPHELGNFNTPNKNIRMSSFKSTESIQKKEGVPTSKFKFEGAYCFWLVREGCTRFKCPLLLLNMTVRVLKFKSDDVFVNYS